MSKLILSALVLLSVMLGLLFNCCSVCLVSSKCKTVGQRAALEIYHISTSEQREELKAFTDSNEVTQFLNEFWLRLDPTPGTPKNEFKDQHYRRYNYANSRFNEANIEGSRSDRGRIYILHGPPDDIFYENMMQHNMVGHRSRSIEVWQYDIPAGRHKATTAYLDFDASCMTFIFADYYGTGAFAQVYSTEADEIDDSKFIQMLQVGYDYYNYLSR